MKAVLARTREPVPSGSGSRQTAGLWRLSLLLLVMALPLQAADKQPVAMQLSDADIDAAIARGTGWLEQHPAAVNDGGLPDMLDEGVAYYVRRNLSRDDTERTRFAAGLQAQMTRLAELPEFEQWVYRGRKTLTDYYHLVLAAHLLRAVGETDEREGEIAAQASGVLRVVQHCDPSKRLTIAIFLQQLGADPGISIPQAIANSRIARIARGQVPILPPPGTAVEARTAASLELYALIHEIVALTDFGRLQPPAWLAQHRTAVINHLDAAVDWAVATGNFDLAAELLMSVRLLHEPLIGNYRDAILAITAGQLEDGSWGSHVTRRENKQRHAVLTATTALWVYRNAPTAMQAEQQELY